MRSLKVKTDEGNPPVRRFRGAAWCGLFRFDAIACLVAQVTQPYDEMTQLNRKVTHSKSESLSQKMTQLYTKVTLPNRKSD